MGIISLKIYLDITYSTSLEMRKVFLYSPNKIVCYRAPTQERGTIPVYSHVQLVGWSMWIQQIAKTQWSECYIQK